MIKIDIDMPNSCIDCQFVSGCDACEGYDNYCELSPDHVFERRIDKKGRKCEHIYPEKRPDWCPLIADS